MGVTCSNSAPPAGNTPENSNENSKLGRCGDIMDPNNKKVINQIDSSVGVKCGKKTCSLFCKDENSIFDSASQIWNQKTIKCARKGFVPKKISAKCVASARRANVAENNVRTRCRNTVFEKYSL